MRVQINQNPTLPPKHNFNASFNYDWELMNKKREIELLRPREICPKRNHSFHTSSNDCDRSFHNRSFERPSQENEKVSSRMQNEFGQLKNIIQKRCNEIEKQQRQQDLKLSICMPKHQNENPTKPKEDTPQFNYYQTFKPIFAKLNTLIENSNTKDKQRLVTLFDSLDQDSIKSSEPEQMISLVEQLVKEFVIPTLENQTPSQQYSKRSYMQSHSSNQIKQTPQQLPPPSMDQSITQRNLFEIQFKNISSFYKEISLADSGFLEYQVVQAVAIGDSLHHFNIAKHQSCKLITAQNNSQIDVRQIKQSVIQEQIFVVNETTTIIPLNSKWKRYIFIMNYPNSYCKQIQQYAQLNINCQLLKQQSGCTLINQVFKKQTIFRRLQLLIRLKSFNNQVKKLRRILLLRGYNKLKQKYFASKQQSNNFLCKLILQSARQVKKDEKNHLQKLMLSLQKYVIKLKGCAFTQMNGNDDVMIMLQALQSESSMEKYLQQVAQLLGDKMVVSILNLELQSLTSFLPEYGLVQEFFDQMGDLSQFDTLYSLTLNINAELQNQNIEFENRHIWKVTNDVFIITCSNMQTNYLSKLALILTNGLYALHQKYLELFRYMRLRQEQYLQKVKSRYFSRWRNNHCNFIDQLREELMSVKQDQDQQQRLIYQYEIEMQNLSIQNALKSKCLSSALLENTLSKRETDAQLKETFFKLWQSKAKNYRHFEQRTYTGLYLLEQTLSKVEKTQLDIAFREIAFSYNHPDGIMPTSPILKNTKRSHHTREQTRRSQEELEQSVLWDVHQMKINTPNTQKGQSLSPMTTHTMNTSFLIENESLYQYHSQRCTQQQKKKQQPSQMDQENVQTQNKICSQRTKDFVRKISQPKQANHRRLHSTQPGSSFSFYDLQH